MNWMSFFIIVGICYAAYYLILILFDLYQAKSISRKVAAKQHVSYEVIETKSVGSYAENSQESENVQTSEEEKKKNIPMEMISEAHVFIKQELGMMSVDIEETGFDINEGNLMGFIKANNQFNLLYV